MNIYTYIYISLKSTTLSLYLKYYKSGTTMSHLSHFLMLHEKIIHQNHYRMRKENKGHTECYIISSALLKRVRKCTPRLRN